MKVKKIMTPGVECCHAKDSLAKAVGIMWQKDCGVVPIIRRENEVVGMITDRDVCIALTSRNQMASDIRISDVINGKPVTCAPNDSVNTALKKMRKHKVKRLPVVSGKGKLKGILSLADILRVKKKKSFQKQLHETLEAISQPDAIVLKQVVES